MSAEGLTREDGKVIGFVVSCLYSCAITRDEFQQWLLYVIDKNEVDDLPLYIFDLLDFNAPLFLIDKVIGFVTGWEGEYAKIYDKSYNEDNDDEELKVVDYYDDGNSGYGSDDLYESYELELSCALSGLALARGTLKAERLEMCPPKRARGDLIKHPWVLDVFKEIFPFINISPVERFLRTA